MKIVLSKAEIEKILRIYFSQSETFEGKKVCGSWVGHDDEMDIIGEICFEESEVSDGK